MKLNSFIILLSYFILISLARSTNEQVISYSMRKIAYSTNQFGLDLLRASKNDKIIFCPFCISSSLVMLLMGSTGEMSNSLKHALYLNGLSENEINFAYFDMMNHLGVNLMPTQKHGPTASTNFFKTPTSSSGNNLDLLNKAGLLSSESQTLTLIPSNYLSSLQSNLPSSHHYNSVLNSLDPFGQRPDSNSKTSFKTNYQSNLLQTASSNGNHIFQPYDFIDRNKFVHPFSPYNNENTHRNNFIKFSTNQLNGNSLDRFSTLNSNSNSNLNSDISFDIKTSNYLFSRRTSRAFGFGKNSFWNSKSYLNPFGTMLNAFQNNLQNSFQYAPNPTHYHQNGIPQTDLVIEKFGQNMNPTMTSIKLPNNFHYYNVKPMSSNKPFIHNGQHNNLTTTITSLSSTNRKQIQSTVASSTLSPITTETPKHYSTVNHPYSFNPHYHYNPNNRIPNNFVKEHPINLNDSLLPNYHSIRLGNTNSDLLNNDFTGNDISFLSNIYVQRDFVINYHYHVLLQKFYKTAIHPLDFIHNAEETRDHINAIVQMQTDNKICNILPEHQSPSTQLLLISALYFKGELDLKLNVTKANGLNSYQNRINNLMNNQTIGVHQHNVSNANSSTLPNRNSNKEPLSRGDQDANDIHNQSEEIWMEASKTRLRYVFDKYLNCSTLEMPFKDSMITLLIMMPSDVDGLDTLLTKLNAQMLNDVINSLEIRRITVKLPKINIENTFRNLTMALTNLGLSDLFRPGHSQLNNISDFKWLYVSDIIHKTHLNIKESSLNNQPIITSKPRGKQDDNYSDLIEIELNKPFLFFIMDNVSGLIVSMGKMGDKHNLETNAYRLPV